MDKFLEAVQHWADTTPTDDFIMIVLMLVVEIIGLFWLARLLFGRKHW